MSYATEIEDRVLHNNWNSEYRVVGRLVMRGIYERKEGSSGNNKVGVEVTKKHSLHEWILRVYVDGTAFFRPNELWMFTSPARNGIAQIIEKYFIVLNAGRSRQILRRKACCKETRDTVNKEQGFNDYIVSKYNRGI